MEPGRHRPAGQNFAHLIDDLLDVSRITQGKIQLRKELIDAAAVIRHAVEAVKPIVEERRHELLLSFTSTDLRLEADPIRLEQILVNLLTNAAKYTPPGGRIRLSPESRGTRSSSGSGTTASASRPRCSRGCSTCSPRPTARSTAPRGAWASG